MEEKVRAIFEGITERFADPIMIGSRCRSNFFYSIEDLTIGELEFLGKLLAKKVINACYPTQPDFLISLPGNRTNITQYLAEYISKDSKPLDIIPYTKIHAGNGIRTTLKDKNVVLVNDVITTARSCLEAHTETTMMRASVLCWASLIDRTFGPGPVPVVAMLTGEPVELVEF